ncbi:MAG: hypothetical protein M3070_02625 [Actinomycetota bacterium]|nr:hypothetical protein [Actinomycetota bacterium]
MRAGAVVGVAASGTSIPAVGLAALLMSARLSAVLFVLLLIAVATQLSVKTTHRQRHGADAARAGKTRRAQITDGGDAILA